jgi:hypothetical protein
MNPLSSRNEGRFSWKKFAAFAGLLCAAVLAVLALLAVFPPSELARRFATAPEAQDARHEALTARVAELVQETEAFRERPEAVSLARYDAEQRAVEQRLTAIEQVLSERSDDRSLLRDRLARLEDEWAQHAANAAAESVNPPALPAAPVSPPSPPNPAPPAPRIAEPSFRVIGVERRAEERFLTILPKGTEALSDTRLLRVGEQENGWRLDAIEEDAGVFSQGGRKRRLSLPGGKP